MSGEPNPLVLAARARMGVPFRHRGRSDRFVDCAGLIKLVYADCGIDIRDQRHYGREPVKDGLVQAGIDAFGPPIATGPVPLAFLKVGDVLITRYEMHPHHVMLVADYPGPGNHLSVIHADGHYSKVIETRLDEKQARKITHVFRRPV